MTAEKGEEEMADPIIIDDNGGAVAPSLRVVDTKKMRDLHGLKTRRAEIPEKLARLVVFTGDEDGKFWWTVQNSPNQDSWSPWWCLLGGTVSAPVIGSSPARCADTRDMTAFPHAFRKYPQANALGR